MRIKTFAFGLFGALAVMALLGLHKQEPKVAAVSVDAASFEDTTPTVSSVREDVVDIDDIDWASVRQAAADMGFSEADLRKTERIINRFTPSIRQNPLGRALQMRGHNPNEWKPDEPFNLDAYTYTPPDVRNAIEGGVEFVLGEQKENGSWDVELTGHLGETADHAIDAVIATSLAGLALRPHVNVAPERINSALRRGADFVIARIIRGKLSLNVYYAVWRYILGLRFLNSELAVLMAETPRNHERVEEIRLVMKRMMQSLMDMQFSSGPASTVDGKKKRKITSRGIKGEAQSASLGMKMAPPTDTDFRGGALVASVLPGSPAATSGIKPGDRVTRVNKNVRIENAYDYYMEEANFIEGQIHEIEFIRQAAGDAAPTKRSVTCRILQKWPANVGVTIEANGSEGVKVTGFTPMSGSRKILSVDDVIIEIGRTKLVGDPKKPETMGKDWVAEFYAAEKELKPLSTIRLQILRDGKKKSISLGKDNVRPKPEGSMGIDPIEEDRCSLDGVGVEDAEEGSVAKSLGLQKGDRIIEIDGTPILGYDHYYSTMATLWADTLVTVKYLKPNFAYSDEKDSKTPITTLDDIGMYTEHTAEVRLGPMIIGGDPQFTPDIVRDSTGAWILIVEEVQKGGVAQGKLQAGDVIVGFNGQKYQHPILLWWFGVGRTAAGEEGTFSVMRNGKPIEVTFEFAKPPSDDTIVEEGGWNYYPMGLGTSFTTAAVIVGLYEVEKTAGIKYPDRSMKAAVAAITSTRVQDPNKVGEIYVYDQTPRKDVDPKALLKWEDARGGIGRIVACEYAAFLKDGRRGKSQLTKAINVFLEHRHELDRVRNFWHTHFSPRWSNAAYYWFYGHYFTLQAANHLDPKGSGKLTKTVHDTCIKALMLKLNCRRPNNPDNNRAAERPAGTWLDQQDFGPLIGTCEALMCFGEIPGSFRVGPGEATKSGPTITPGGGTTPDKDTPSEEPSEQ